MNQEPTIESLLETYYEGFAKKQGWESVIADDFQFTGGDLTRQTPLVGRAAYVEVINRFSRVFDTMHVQQLISEGDRASVIGNYDFCFPNGVRLNGNVAELWTAKNGKLASLQIFFDTACFEKNTPR
jgi:ketosteroid isomerase-like protein